MKRLDVNLVEDYPNHPRTRSCGAVIFHRLNGDNAAQSVRYLIIKNCSRYGDNWDFPKGKMESTETEEETARRETFEEVGLNIELIDGFRQEIHYLVNKSKILKTTVYFIAESKGLDLNIDPVEIEAYEWLEYDLALDKLTYEQAKNVLRKAKEFVLNKN